MKTKLKSAPTHDYYLFNDLKDFLFSSDTDNLTLKEALARPSLEELADYGGINEFFWSQDDLGKRRICLFGETKKVNSHFKKLLKTLSTSDVLPMEKAAEYGESGDVQVLALFEITNTPYSVIYIEPHGDQFLEEVEEMLTETNLTLVYSVDDYSPLMLVQYNDDYVDQFEEDLDAPMIKKN